MRKDARRVDVSALMQCCIDLKPSRKENEVYIDRKLNVSRLVEYMDKSREDGKHYTYFHAFLTAVAKVMYNRSKLNRFIANRHMYEHNQILLSFVAKVTLDDKAEEMMLVIPIDEDDNIETISAKTAEKVNRLRNAKAEKKGANQFADLLGKLPNIIRVPIFAVIKRLGEYGMLPKSMTDNNIYFTSMIISNLGSIECGAIYHNLADFGTCSSLLTIGEIETEKHFNKQGKEEVQKVCHVGVTLDERIADGFYFARTVQMIEHVLQNPEMLENSVSEKIEM